MVRRPQRVEVAAAAAASRNRAHGASSASPIMCAGGQRGERRAQAGHAVSCLRQRAAPAARARALERAEGFAKAHAAFTACSARFNRHSSENARAYLSIAC